MVFSSLPLYLDPPNWQQHEVHQNPNPQLQGASSSMAEKARMARIPAMEGPLSCPRCDSTNTKFCYFNNYSLTQPRHFCKACRRYWTCGGALRNVPVGGGVRRNKRRKRAKSPKAQAEASSAHQQPLQMPDQHLTVASEAPFSFMAHQHQQQQQQQLSLFGGFGVGLTEPLSSTMYYPFPFQQINGGGGMETASFGVKMEEMRLKGGVTENMSRFWGANFNNSVAGSANGGLWN